MLRYNAGHLMEKTLLPLAIGGAGPTSMVFVKWLCDKDTIDLGEGMNYREDRHEYTIDLLRFCKLLDAPPEGMNEEVWNYHALDKHYESIEEKIT